MGTELTSRAILELLRAHTQEILKQVGFERVRLSVSVKDSQPCIRASVRPERVKEVPTQISVHTDEGIVEIPVKVTGDYEDFELH